MQFQFISTLFLFLMTFTQTLHGQSCDCLSCPARTNVSLGAEDQLSNSALCPAGKAAAVSSINIQSTDGSGFQVYTMDDPKDTTYYSAGSTASTVTCFKMGRGLSVGGQKPRIYVVIKCKSALKACLLRYSISITCVNIATTTTTTAKPTTPSTAKPIQPSTAIPLTVVDTCECHCCRGSNTCAPVHVGTIFYYTNTCAPSDCANRCSNQFPLCPIEGIQSGKLQTYCKSNTGSTLKNVFYISLSALLLSTFNIL